MTGVVAAQSVAMYRSPTMQKPSQLHMALNNMVNELALWHVLRCKEV